ncbi:Clp protease N-terminal domain-containing protein [Amycolatopsis lurida]
MFGGDHPELGRTMTRASAVARALEHRRVGSEHVLLALTTGTFGSLLARHGATETAIRDAVCRAAPAGASAAADREDLAVLGVDLDRLLDGETAVLDRRTAREPLFPLGAAKAHRRCASAKPPIGLDTQAVYAASLRLALARRERDHRVEHLALTLLTLDPGAAWTLTAADVDRAALLTAMVMAFPPPRRNPVLRADRRIGLRARHRDIVRRYQRTTGRSVTAADAFGALIA